MPNKKVKQVSRNHLLPKAWPKPQCLVLVGNESFRNYVRVRDCVFHSKIRSERGKIQSWNYVERRNGMVRRHLFKAGFGRGSNCRNRQATSCEQAQQNRQNQDQRRGSHVEADAGKKFAAFGWGFYKIYGVKAGETG